MERTTARREALIEFPHRRFAGRGIGLEFNHGFPIVAKRRGRRGNSPICPPKLCTLFAETVCCAKGVKRPDRSHRFARAITNEMKAAITGIAYHLPEHGESNADLAKVYPDWNSEKVLAKTGINCRRISAPGECSSDLGVKAAQKLFAQGACEPQEIDFLLFCTQTPDYFLPTTACLIQERLGLRQEIGALDFNLGCSGFVYGLGVAKAWSKPDWRERFS